MLFYLLQRHHLGGCTAGILPAFFVRSSNSLLACEISELFSSVREQDAHTTAGKMPAVHFLLIIYCLFKFFKKMLYRVSLLRVL